MIQPAAHRLRPLTLGDILDTAISLYRNNFALFVGVVAVIAVPEAIISLVLRLASPASPLTTTTSSGLSGNGSTHFHWHFGYFGGSGLELLITIVFNVLISGALARTISERYLGRGITLGEAYTSVGMGGFVTLGLASILSGICIALPTVIAVVLIVLLLLLHAVGLPLAIVVLVSIPIGLAAIVFTVIVWIRLQFVPQAIVIERRNVANSLSRSWNLVSGSSWRVLGIILVVSLLVGIVSAIVGGVLGIPLAIVNVAAGGVVGSIVGILLQPFQFAAYTLLYYDLRVRKEGFDMEQLATHIGGINPLPS